MEERLYFAYADNINRKQMAYRCPAAEVVGPVTLYNYELLFRCVGIATIAPKTGKQVHGLLWKITPDCERALNRYENYPRIYEQQEVTVRDRNGQKFTVMAYVMSNEQERAPTLPPSFYYQQIREGYRQNGLPVKSLNAALEHCQNEVLAQCTAAPRMIYFPKKKAKGGRSCER